MKRTAWALNFGQIATALRRGIHIFACHMVPFWEADAFEEVISFVGSQFQFVSLTEIVRMVGSSGRLRRSNLAALTFDDGFRNHYKVAYPILRRHSIPATFFVCADLIGSKASIWTWEIDARLKRLSKEEQTRLLGTTCDPLQWLKSIPIRDRERLVQRIVAADPEFRFTASEEELYSLMTWDQLTSLDSELITIGSHTLSHIDLTTAGDSRLDYELSESRHRLEERLGRQVAHFCYPDGDHDSRTRRAVAKYYESGITSDQGLNRRGDNPFALRRIHIQYDVSQLAWEITRSAILGKHS